MILIYIIVIFTATFLGAIAGLGGGVIIKPVLDLLGYHDISTISFISTCAVFTMALYSVSKQLSNKIKLDWLLAVCIAIGAAIGGNIGNRVFQAVLHDFDSLLVSSVQAVFLILLLLVVLFQVKHKDVYLSLDHWLSYLLIGFILGCISAFLGIGGGPINVAVFMFFFAVPLKMATIYSLVTILFSQVSKLFSIALSTGFLVYDLSILCYVLPTALLGGIIGTYLYKLIDEKTTARLFNGAVICIIVINVLIIVKHMVL